MTLWIILDYSSDVIYYMDTFVRSRTGKEKTRGAFSKQNSFFENDI